jgi:hypothetical protein
MPPHCDAIDGPVARAAIAALEAGDVEIVFPFVPKEAEPEVRSAFERVRSIRTLRGTVRDVADRYFLETVVRFHRMGEGASFTGLKPACLDPGPVLPLAERAIEDGSAEELTRELTDVLEAAIKRRLDRVSSLRVHAGEGVDAARASTEAMLHFEVWANGIYRSLIRDEEV